PSYESLVSRLNEPNALALQEQIIEAITTRETSFNRDAHPFDELRRTILPELAARLLDRRARSNFPVPTARIWCAAAANGQEAYSVAMAVSEFVAARKADGLTVDQFPILVTDISNHALTNAREGRFTGLELARGTTAAQRDRFFRPDGTAWV